MVEAFYAIKMDGVLAGFFGAIVSAHIVSEIIEPVSVFPFFLLVRNLCHSGRRKGFGKFFESLDAF